MAAREENMRVFINDREEVAVQLCPACLRLLGRDICWQYIEERGLQSSDICADLVATHAVSSLKIGEEIPLSKIFS
ncbi:hypothetical protein Leryth_027183 [Lithospermum erythrorhizon]|nr:hypothetical protein Leryth_027183 [Lithospermum erythrorhizon]